MTLRGAHPYFLGRQVFESARSHDTRMTHWAPLRPAYASPSPFPRPALLRRQSLRHRSVGVAGGPGVQRPRQHHRRLGAEGADGLRRLHEHGQVLGLRDNRVIGRCFAWGLGGSLLAKRKRAGGGGPRAESSWIAVRLRISLRSSFAPPQISCAWGFTTTGGAKGVGESTTSAVVISLVAIFVADFVLSYVFYQGQGSALKQLK